MTTVAQPDPLARSLTEYAYRPVGPNGILRWDPDWDPMASAIDLTDYRGDWPSGPTDAEVLAEMRAALDALSRMELGPPGTATTATTAYDAAGGRAGHSTSDEGSALPHSRPEARA